MNSLLNYSSICYQEDTQFGISVNNCKVTSYKDFQSHF